MYKCCFLACFCASQRVQRRKVEISLAQIREKLPNGWADWHQIWHKSANSSGNGHRINTIRPSIPQGVLGGSQIQKSVEAVKRLDRLAPNLAHMCTFIWEWIYSKQIALRDTRWALGGFRGSNIKKSREAVKRTLVHVCGFIWKWT